LGKFLTIINLIDINLIFIFDTLALTLVVLVSFLTPFALYFGIEYMYRESNIIKLLYLLNMFATSVIFLFISFDLFLILISWESIGLFSLLLVNFYSNRVYTLKAALKTFIFSRFSDLFLMVLLVLSLVYFNSLDLSYIFIQTPYFLFFYINLGPLSIHFLSLYTLSISLTGVIKSAQFFFHV